GGYFMFTRSGMPIAGGMGGMGDTPADDSWKIYLASDALEKTVRAAEEAGAQIVSEPVQVADLGIQSVLVDPTGAPLVVWQPLTFPGFTVLGENGSPSWFELLTPDYSTAVEFYRSVFGWDTEVVSDSPELRYTTMRDPDGELPLAGIMDASSVLPAGGPARWSVYWKTDDVDGSVAKVTEL